MGQKRITIFAGHYGSGKTNIAVNYSKMLAQQDKEVFLADLDIVNPYFRAADSAQDLEQFGVKVLVSQYANTNLDIPAIPPQMYSLINNKKIFGVMDIGGDDRGAYALGRYALSILQENNYEMLLVINKYRPLSSASDDTVEIMKEIETAAKIKFTGIVNNSNLGSETTPQDVLSSLEYGKEISQKSGLPIKFTTVEENLYSALSGKIENLVPITLQKKLF